MCQATLRQLDKENRYLKRKLDRLLTQQLRQERIDEMNRFQAKRANSRLEVARAVAEQSNRAKSEFLANMSHEIRTPLNIVLGMAELLDGTILDPAQRQYLSSLRQSGQHLLKLIDNILDFSRIESGSIEIEAEPFDLHELLGEVEEMGKHLSRKKGIDFSVHLGPGLLRGYHGDQGKIKQILLNFVTNAVKFTTVGGVRLEIYSAPEKLKHGMRFLVVDSGQGIPTEKQDIIFQRFAQVARESAGDQSGVGLGLAISQRLAIAMGGEIDFHSREGKGTTFEVTIPLPPVYLPARATKGSARKCSVLPEQLPPLRILAVDDVKLNLEIIRHFLAGSQVVVDSCGNGREAIKQYGRRHYDALLMDIRMPVMDGSRATGIIRRLEKRAGAEPVPIVAITAHAFREQKKSFLAEGFDEVMTKPFSRDTLVKTLLGVTLRQPLKRKEVSGNKVLGSVLESNTEKPALPETLAALVPEFLEMVSGAFRDMKQAINKKDFSSLETVCHSVKGVAGMYGFKNLFSLVENIEQSVKERNLQSIVNLTASLGYYIEQLERESLPFYRN